MKEKEERDEKHGNRKKIVGSRVLLGILPAVV